MNNPVDRDAFQILLEGLGCHVFENQHVDGVDLYAHYGVPGDHGHVILHSNGTIGLSGQKAKMFRAIADFIEAPPPSPPEPLHPEIKPVLEIVSTIGTLNGVIAERYCAGYSTHEQEVALEKAWTELTDALSGRWISTPTPVTMEELFPELTDAAKGLMGLSAYRSEQNSGS